jgi:pimeloyl-ACP methyl ester carboxylesterase
MGLLFSLASMAPVRSIMGAVPRWVFAVYAKSTVYDSRKIPSQIIGFYFDLLKTRDFRQVLLSMQRESFTFFGHSGTAIRDVAASLNMIDKKTLIIWGKNDTMIPVANAYRGHKLIANSQLTIFDRCSHNPQYEKALEFNALVSEFLLNS